MKQSVVEEVVDMTIKGLMVLQVTMKEGMAEAEEEGQHIALHLITDLEVQEQPVRVTMEQMEPPQLVLVSMVVVVEVRVPRLRPWMEEKEK